ncbi:hypothetical protein ACNKHT_20435 [Shigella flexneri]
MITGEGVLTAEYSPAGTDWRCNIGKNTIKPVIGIAGSLTVDVGVVHQHGIDSWSSAY